LQSPLAVEKFEHVVESSLIAVVPIGLLRRSGIEVPLLEIRMLSLLRQPLANAISALGEECQVSVCRHVVLDAPLIAFLGA